MKKIMIAGLALAMTLSLASCGSKKHSEYRKAYEAAKERELAQTDTKKQEVVEEVIEYEVPKNAREVKTTAPVRKEKVSAYKGEDQNNLRRFSVVIGSFQNPTNAKSLKERMTKMGYNAVLAKNEIGMLRVIITSFDTREEATASREAIKARFAPDFQDAWLLEKI